MPQPWYPLEHAISASRTILLRTCEGGVVLLHLSLDGQPTWEDLDERFASIFASEGRLFAVRDGVVCELRE